MKAIALREFGGADVLRMEELPIPSPAAAEVLIRVHSVSVNQTLDLKVREGSYRTDLRFPVVLGADPAGVIVDTGAGCRRRVAASGCRWWRPFAAASAASAAWGGRTRAPGASI